MSCFVRRNRQNTHTLLAESYYCNQRLSPEVCNMIIDGIGAMHPGNKKIIWLIPVEQKYAILLRQIHFALDCISLNHTSNAHDYVCSIFPNEQFMIHGIRWNLVSWRCNQYSHTGMQKLYQSRCQIASIFKFPNRSIRSDICHWTKPTIILS